MQQLELEDAHYAIRMSKELGQEIVLYLSSDRFVEERNGNWPEIGLVFIKGVYDHYCLGPGDMQWFTWMDLLIRFIDRCKGRDVSKRDTFIKVVYAIANAGFIGKCG
jgi:hypothetical protein